jgi:hypothetical protein
MGQQFLFPLTITKGIFQYNIIPYFSISSAGLQEVTYSHILKCEGNMVTISPPETIGVLFGIENLDHTAQAIISKSL